VNRHAGARRAVGASPPGAGPISLLALLREDRATHWGSWGRPGAPALAVHRLGRWAEEKPGLARTRLLRPVCRLLEVLVRRRTGIHLSRSARIGRRLRIGHQGGVAVASGVRIGDDCVIRQRVRIEGGRGEGAPVLGHRVSIGAGAIVSGPVRIGDDATIGPNAVVTSDVPAGASAIAPPSRIERAPLDQRNRKP
jgi:serine O-acetyltransferase